MTQPEARPIALITGASAGIGQDIARVLAGRGYDLVLTARREAELIALGQELTRQNAIVCHIVPADLADPAEPRRLFQETVEKGLQIDVLVNNAGFGDLGPFAEADLGKMLKMVRVNVSALVELTGLFLPGMLRRGHGRVLNVGSVAGFQPGPFMAIYYATKAFVNSFSEAVASEVRGSSVTVTVLCPGPTRSEFAAASGMNATQFFEGRGVLASYPVAEAGVKAMLAGKRVVITGWRNKLLLLAERVLPRSVVVWAVHRMQATRHKAKA